MTVEDETILVDSGGSKMITLNSLGGAIWETVAEPTALSDVVDGICERYPDVDRTTIDADVRAFINRTTELGVIRLMA